MLSAEGLQSQNIFYLQNPSFEADRPSAGRTPTDWINLGPETESPPDIQPGAFEAKAKAQDGKMYLGLVVRDNGSWEGVGQRLNGWLRKDSVYTFSLWLAHSPRYLSLSRMTQKEANYNAPTMLKIWGVNNATQQEELLGETEAVGHSHWLRYVFTLSPKVADFDEINLMAFYAEGSLNTNGNLLIDNCSPIEKK
ncbi:MAG TPA: hypothetical protein PK971_16115 [Saprospiraceae bacterium]|nr:hypothetical protein [Saprospiraceae bacterium]HND89858.1 hypothetical protein [Saprospiraceae bacterium]